MLVVRTLWLGTAALLVAVAGVGSAGAATIPVTPTEAKLEAPPGGAVVLVKKNKAKGWKKRHGLRNGNKQRRARRDVPSHRHIARREHAQGFVVIVPMDPDVVFAMPPWPDPVPVDPGRDQALRTPPPPGPEEPYRKGPAHALSNEHHSTITGRGEPSTSALSRMSCDDGAGIVSSFGFSNVEPERCSGATYDFAATRDGQSYRITMNASDGELVEVRRQ